MADQQSQDLKSESGGRTLYARIANTCEGVAESFGMRPPTVGEMIGLKQGVLMSALADYNEAIEAARVLQPNENWVRLEIEVADERPCCVGCGQRIG